MGNKESKDRECQERMRKMLEEAKQKKLLLEQTSPRDEAGGSVKNNKKAKSKSSKSSGSASNSNKD